MVLAERPFASTFLVAALALSSIPGCAVSRFAAGPGVAHDEALTAARAMPTPPPLARSLFARDPAGQLGEEALQKILAAPWEMALPARVGVVPIVPAADSHGPAPSGAVPPAAGALSRALRGEHFTLVTEVMAIPSGSLGIEALRELAARYRLRYLVLYREEIGTDRFANGLASLYATLLGAFFVPGETLRAAGYVEASLLDVKTGLLLCTVRRPVFEEERSNVWGTRQKLARTVARLALGEVPELARDLKRATSELVAAAKEEVAQRAGAQAAALPVPHDAMQQAR